MKGLGRSHYILSVGKFLGFWSVSNRSAECSAHRMDTVRLNQLAGAKMAGKRSSRSAQRGLCTSFEMANIVTRMATSNLRCLMPAASRRSGEALIFCAPRLYPRLGSNVQVGKRSGAICQRTFEKNFVLDRISKGAARLARNGRRRGTAGGDYG